MNGSDLVGMTLNIGGETFRLNADFNKQDSVREAEFAVRQYFNKLRRNWPDSSDKKLLAMTAYQFAFWLKEAGKMERRALELTQDCMGKLDKINSDLTPDSKQKSDSL